MLTGFVEAAHINEFHFDRELRSFDTLGYAKNPSVDSKNDFIGDVVKAKETSGASLFDSMKTGGQKRKREVNWDASDVDNYTGTSIKNYLGNRYRSMGTLQRRKGNSEARSRTTKRNGRDYTEA